MPKTLTNEQLDREVLLTMNRHQGKDNDIERWTLVVKVFGPGADLPRSDNNIYDRQVRDSIGRLRHQGHLIANLGDGGGLFLANTVEEYQAFRQYYGRHAWPIMETIREMDKAAEQQWPNPLQPRML